MKTGTVKFYKNGKGKGNGFGFITPDEGGKDVFVHFTGVLEEIQTGDKVSYEVEEGTKGPKAVKVTRV